MSLRKILLPVALVLISAFAGYWLGSRSANQLPENPDPQVLADVHRGHSAWMHASENLMFMNIERGGKRERLASFFGKNMWRSIVPLEHFTQNPHAPKDDREAATRILSMLILYFYEHPREFKPMGDLSLADDVQEKLKEMAKDPSAAPQESKLIEQIAQESKGQFNELEDGLNETLNELDRQNLRTQALVDELIEQRFFPGKELTAGNITVFTPGRSVRHSSGPNEFEIESRHLEKEFFAVYEGKNLLVNGEDFGPLNKGDIVDFRMPGKVFINDVERAPVK